MSLTASDLAHRENGELDFNEIATGRWLFFLRADTIFWKDFIVILQGRLASACGQFITIRLSRDAACSKSALRPIPICSSLCNSESGRGQGLRDYHKSEYSPAAPVCHLCISRNNAEAEVLCEVDAPSLLSTAPDVLLSAANMMPSS
jgi:hypothetical protein